MDEQDLRLARLAEREGRAVVIALNKWDAVEDRRRRAARVGRAGNEPGAVAGVSWCRSRPRRAGAWRS
jgi:hypothetical protein